MAGHRMEAAGEPALLIHFHSSRGLPACCCSQGNRLLGRSAIQLQWWPSKRVLLFPSCFSCYGHCDYSLVGHTAATHPSAYRACLLAFCSVNNAHLISSTVCATRTIIVLLCIASCRIRVRPIRQHRSRHQLAISVACFEAACRLRHAFFGPRVFIYLAD